MGKQILEIQKGNTNLRQKIEKYKKRMKKVQRSYIFLTLPQSHCLVLGSSQPWMNFFLEICLLMKPHKTI